MIYDVHETQTTACQNCGRNITLPAAPVSWWRHDHNDSRSCWAIGGCQAVPRSAEESHCSECGVEIPNLQCGGLCEDCLAAGPES